MVNLAPPLPHRTRGLQHPVTVLIIVSMAAAGHVVACNLPTDDLACTGSIEPAIVVRITNARTGAPLAGGAAGIVRDGPYADSLRPYEFLSSDPASMISRRAANERAGIYSVDVIHPGYGAARFDGVEVVAGRCHVVTRVLDAALRPTS